MTLWSEYSALSRFKSYLLLNKESSYAGTATLFNVLYCTTDHCRIKAIVKFHPRDQLLFEN